MDTVPQSEASNDIFSLSDDGLSECLDFIDEVGIGLLLVSVLLKLYLFRLVLVIGEAFGYVDLDPPQPQMGL